MNLTEMIVTKTFFQFTYIAFSVPVIIKFLKLLPRTPYRILTIVFLLIRFLAAYLEKIAVVTLYIFVAETKVYIAP